MSKSKKQKVKLNNSLQLEQIYQPQNKYEIKKIKRLLNLFILYYFKNKKDWKFQKNIMFKNSIQFIRKVKRTK